MQIANWTAPLYVAGMSLVVLAAITRGRRFFDSVGSGTRRFVVALVALIILSLLAEVPGSHLVWTLERLLMKGLGLSLLIAGAWVALKGTRARLHADALCEGAASSVDEGVQMLRVTGKDAHVGVFRGRLSAAEEVTSPGGIVCAFYDAELRQVAADGRKGALISSERAYAPLLSVRGERAEVGVRFSPTTLHAPVQIHRCLTSAQLASCDERSAYAGAPPVEEALSYERVGKLGEACVVVGELRPGPAPGSYVLQGMRSGPALLAMGEDVERLGRAFARRSWGFFAVAAGLVMASAFLLSGRL